MSSLPANLAERKRLGAWYTPQAIVGPLVRWAIRPGDTSVLDPAVGDGGFLVNAAARLASLNLAPHTWRLIGFDVNPLAVAATTAALARQFRCDTAQGIRVSDFFEVDPPGSPSPAGGLVDAVVGNPPYIRFQSFAGENRARALRRARDLGVRLTRLSSSWAPFVIHATAFVRPGGRLALVLPEELIHASYAEEVRAFLRRSFETTSLISFERHLFPDSQERILLLLSEGKGVQPGGELRLVAIRHPDGITSLEAIIKDAEVYRAGDEPDKWEPGFHDAPSRDLAFLEARKAFVPLSTVGKAGIGYVSGANEYFVLTPMDAERHRFPLRLLKPTVSAARHIGGAILSRRDMDQLSRRGEHCLLWDGGGAHLRSVAAYVGEGERREIHKRYKCRVRSPWYRVPGVKVPHAFLTYMSDVFPRLVINRTRATCSNTLLAVNLDGIPAAIRPAFVASFYNSATMLSAERVGRRYGGGVLKLEPSEADRLLVPGLSLIAQNPGLGAALSQIDSLLRGRRFDEALALGDSAILEGVCGLPNDQVSRLRQAVRIRRAARESEATAMRRCSVPETGELFNQPAATPDRASQA